MRSLCKRVLSLAVTAALLVGVLLTNGSAYLTAQGAVLFFDDFASGALSGWQDTAVGTVSGGKYYLSGQEHNLIAHTGSRAGLWISADVTVSIGADEQGIRKNSLASLLVNADPSGTAGYEFGIGVAKDGTTFVRLYQRGPDHVSKILFQQYADIPGAAGGTIAAGQAYALSVGVYDGTINGFINGELVVSCENTAFAEGFCGVKTAWSGSVFDNVKVEEIPAKTVSGLELQNVVSEISVVGELQFDAVIHYEGSFHQDEILPADSDRLEIRGFSRTEGTKTVTVAYGGKQQSFTLTVTGAVPEQTVFSDDFSAAPAEGTYTPLETVREEYNLRYGFAVANDRLEARLPQIPSGYDQAVTAKYTLNTEAAAGVEQYYAQADAVISGSIATVSKRNAIAEISAVTAADGVYRFRAVASGTLELYRDSTRLAVKSISAVSGASFALGETFTLAMQVSENILICTYNGKTAFVLTDIDLSTFTPKISLAAYNGEVAFDNFKVVRTEKRSADAARTAQLRSTADDSAITRITAKELQLEKLYLAVEYVDGSTGSVGITGEMLSGYNPDVKANQTAVITYGPVRIELAFIYSAYLFYDDFTGSTNPGWSFTTASEQTAAVRNDMLKTEWTTAMTDNICSGTVEDGGDWYNYAVSADISFDQKMVKETTASFISLFSRRNGSSYYDLRFLCRAGNLSVNLYRYADGTNTLVQSFTESFIQNKLGTKVLAAGVQYNLKMICKDDTLYIYLDDILLGTYTDTASDAPGSGTAGFKAAKVSGTLDNFVVEELGSLNIVRIEIDGVENNTLEIYEGFSVNPYEYNINCIDADGVCIVKPLEAEMLSFYDNLEVGTQPITVTAMGKTQEITLVVKNRDEYIGQLSTELEALDPASLTAADKDAVYALGDRCDSLSGYEMTKLSEKAAENYRAAVERLELLLYPELADQGILYSNDFSAAQQNPDDWYAGVEPDCGAWEIINGSYQLEQTRFGVSGTSWRVVEPVYGEIASVSAKMMMTSLSMYLGLAINIGAEGYYQARVKTDVYDDAGNPVPYIQVLKKTDDHQRLLSEPLAGYGVSLSEGEWFTMRMTFVKGVVAVYINDVKLFEYDDSDAVQVFAEGQAGVRVSSGNARFDNLVIRGTATQKRTSTAVITPTAYADDFEDETAGGDPSHWVEENTADRWKVYADGDGKAYGTGYMEGYTCSWLHVFEKDPAVKLDFKVDDADSRAVFGVFIRMAPETAYARLGYDFAQGKWYMTETQGERDCDINTVYADGATALEKGEWHSLEISASGRKVEVKLDGAVVLSADGVSQTGFGRIGVYTNGAALSIDNVEAAFPNGDTVQDGVIEYTVDQNIYSGNLELEETGDGNMVGTSNYMTVYSSDYGQTFQVVGGRYASEEDIDESFAAIDSLGMYASTIQLHDGSYLYVRQADFIVQRSTDGMKSFTAIGRVIAEEDLIDESGRMPYLIHVNSLTEIRLGDGSYRIFLPVTVRVYGGVLSYTSSGHYTVVYYSDDGGATWKTSETTTKDVLTGYTEQDTSSSWAESKVIQCADGTLRMHYSRNTLGCMQYTVSYDDGVTWEGMYQIPEMQCARSSYNIVADPTEEYTYYMIWVNNTPTSLGSNFSRTRLSLAKTTDGIHWEYLCDLERMSEEVYGSNPVVTTPLFQIVDPSILVTEDYVYVTFGRSDGTDPQKVPGSATSYHNGLRARLVRIEKDKLTAKPWDASNISDMLFVRSLEVTAPVKTKFGLGDLFFYAGGEVTATSLDGSTQVLDTSRFFLLEEPDMFTLGTQTVSLYNSNGTMTSYAIEIVNRYTVQWNVSGNGTVDPMAESVLEGDELRFTLSPGDFFAKVGHVMVNGEAAAREGSTVVVPAVSGNLEIEVLFVQKGFLDWLPYILILLAAAGGVTTAVILLVRRRARRRPKAGEEG